MVSEKKHLTDDGRTTKDACGTEIHVALLTQSSRAKKLAVMLTVEWIV